MKNIRLINISGLVILAMCSACASVETTVSLSRLESPETRGESLKLSGEFGIGSTVNIQLVSDASYRPPSINAPANMATGNELYGKLIGSIVPWIDLDFRDGTGGNVPAIFNAKFQLLGKSSKESQVGNFSLAAIVSGGGTTQDKSGSQQGSFGPGGYPWNTNLTTTMQSLAAVLGYRVSNGVLFYGGGFRDTYYASGTIHQALSDNGQSGPAQYNIGGDGINLGGNIDLEISFNSTRSALLTLELMHSTVSWTGGQSLSPTSVGSSLQIRF